MNKYYIYIICFILCNLVILPFGIAKAESLQELEAKRKQLESQINENQDKVTQKEKTISNIDDMIENLNSQISNTENEISLQNQKITLLNQKIEKNNEEISQAEKNLAEKQNDLNITVTNIYEMQDYTFIEAILNSKSLSDLINRQQYMDNLTYQLDSQMEKINKIKSDLEEQKKQLLADQDNLTQTQKKLENTKNSLVTQNNQQNSLRKKNVAEKNEFNEALSSLTRDRDEVSAEIYNKRLALAGYRTGTSGYPFAASEPDLGDYWGFATRECTSYAAWYWNARLGKSWYNTRPGSGSAWNWPALAQDQGYSVNSTPQVGAIVSWDRGGIFGQYGHVAIVEKVNSNGTINVSEYNWIKFSYSERDNVSTSGARFIY